MRHPALVLAALVLVVAACSGPSAERPGADRAGAPGTADATGDQGTSSEIGESGEELSGRLTAYTGQSSTDASLGRMQVYVENGTAREVVPEAITYVDRRLGGRLAGDRVRVIPSGSARGYLVALPARPDCGVDRSTRGRVVVTGAGGRTVVPVDDPVGTVRRHLDLRCDQVEVLEAARLTWLPPSIVGRGASARADLVLDVRPSGEAGRRLRIDRVNGTPVLAPVGSDVWRPGVVVAGDDPPRRVRLAVRPRRCDPHAFAESGGATAMRIGVNLDGRPRELVLRMPRDVAAAVLDHALSVCGLGD